MVSAILTTMHPNSKNLKLHTKLIAVSALTGREEAREEFCLFDRDGKGYIAETELRNALWNLDANPSEDEIIRIIKEADVEADETISKQDLLKSVGKLNGHFTEDVQDAIGAFERHNGAFVSVGQIKRNSIACLDKQSIADYEECMVGQHEQSTKQRDNNDSGGRNKYESFVTILIQSKPCTRKGCIRQKFGAEGDTEIDKWRRRWRRNAATRSSSIIFPKTWWLLIAKINLQRHKGNEISLKMSVYYWLS